MNPFQLKEDTKKILITIGIVILFIIGSQISIPDVYPLSSTSARGATDIVIMNNFSWFMLGATPCVFADMVLMILSSGVSPFFTRLKREGKSGQEKLRKVKYVLSALFSFAVGMIYIKNAQDAQTFLFVAKPETTAFWLSVGSIGMIYLSTIIDKKGIGHGMSFMILLTISRSIINSILYTLQATPVASHPFQAQYITTLIILGILGIYLFLMIQYDKKKHVIKVNDDNADSRFGESEIAFLYNSAGITPVFFTSILLSMSSGLFTIEDTTIATIVNCLLFYVIFAIMMLICTYLRIKPKQRAKKMEVQGLMIPNVLPGNDTYVYLRKETLITVAKATAFLIVCDVIMRLLVLIPCLYYFRVDTMTLLLLGVIVHQVWQTLQMMHFNQQPLPTLY